MSGRHPFTELTKDFTPERRQRIDRMKAAILRLIHQGAARLSR